MRAMPIFDMKTVFAAYLISNSPCLFATAHLWRHNRDRYAGPGHWLASSLLILGSSLLMLFRGSLPDFLSILLANGMFAGGMILLIVGLERFAGKPGPRARHAICCLSAMPMSASWGMPAQRLHADVANVLEPVHPEDRERVLAGLQRSETAGEIDIEYRIVRPDGTVRRIHDRSFPVLDAQGRVERIAGIASDITERKRAE